MPEGSKVTLEMVEKIFSPAAILVKNGKKAGTFLLEFPPAITSAHSPEAISQFWGDNYIGVAGCLNNQLGSLGILNPAQVSGSTLLLNFPADMKPEVIPQIFARLEFLGKWMENLRPMALPKPGETHGGGRGGGAGGSGGGSPPDKGPRAKAAHSFLAFLRSNADASPVVDNMITVEETRPRPPVTPPSMRTLPSPSSLRLH